MGSIDSINNLKRNFFYNHMNADLNLDDIDYTVEIPQAIIAKAQQ